jgi:pSer/pThr/pTyr-binding forkhead associated (FHA) protein
MNSTVTLTLIKDEDVAGEFSFSERAQCIVGRSRDCEICVPADIQYQDVSRHHCEFEIDPPSVRLRDLGSLNGTFVNGVKVGQRENLKWAEDETIGASGAVTLSPGDEVHLGQHTTLRVSVFPPPEYAVRGSRGGHEREPAEEPHHARHE